MKGSKATGVTMDIELVERCDRLRLAGPCLHYSLKGFREMILEIGMNKYERSILPIPGVSIDHEVTYQNALDGFLREMGYIE